MELDIAPNGEKRKTTPPDLLTLSNMYFERNQVRRQIFKKNREKD